MSIDRKDKITKLISIHRVGDPLMLLTKGESNVHRMHLKFSLKAMESIDQPIVRLSAKSTKTYQNCEMKSLIIN